MTMLVPTHEWEEIVEALNARLAEAGLGHRAARTTVNGLPETEIELFDEHNGLVKDTAGLADTAPVYELFTRATLTLEEYAAWRVPLLMTDIHREHAEFWLWCLEMWDWPTARIEAEIATTLDPARWHAMFEELTNREVNRND